MKVLLMLICLSISGIGCDANAQTSPEARDGTQIIYDSQGVRTGKAVTTGDVTVVYDAQGRRVGKEVTMGGVTIIYDAQGRRTGHKRGAK